MTFQVISRARQARERRGAAVSAGGSNGVIGGPAKRPCCGIGQPLTLSSAHLHLSAPAELDLRRRAIAVDRLRLGELGNFPSPQVHTRPGLDSGLPTEI